MEKWKVKYNFKTVGRFDTEEKAVSFANFLLMVSGWTVSPSRLKIIGHRDGKRVSYKGK